MQTVDEKRLSVMPVTSTKSREVIFGSRIRGAKIHADGAREAARKAVREPDRAEAWSIRMEGYGGPAQPSPTIRAMPELRLRLAASEMPPVRNRSQHPCVYRKPYSS
jgi:hypothetical protein